MPYARTVAALALALGASSAFAGARPWTLVDAVAAPFIDDVQLAPDGRIALVEIDRTDVAHNAFLTNYRAVVVASGATAAMSDDLSRPRWSPDSKSIAWLAAAKGGNALVVTDSRGARRRIFPSGGRNVIALSWSPDGRSIAAIETSSASTAGPRLFWLTSESDYRGTRPPPRSLWLIDVATGTQREITRDGWSYGGPETDHDPSWASDGSRIALVRQPTPVYGDFEHAQYVSVQLSDGRVTQIVNHPFFAYPASAAPVFGPNGAIAYAHTWDGKLASREDVFVDGRDVSAALDRDLWSCSNGTIAWQGGMLIAGLMDGAAIRLFVLDPTGAAAPKPITPDDGSVVAYSIAADGTIAYLWTTPQLAPELFVRSAAGTTRQVTQLSRLPADLPVATTRYVTWPAADGHTLHGLLTVPSSEATAPLIMEPHGGPQCATPIGFAPYVQAIEFYKALAENGAPVQILADPKAGHGPNDPQGFMDWWSSTVAWFVRYGGIPIADGKLP